MVSNFYKKYTSRRNSPLGWYLQLRWLAVIGQAVTLYFASGLLKLPVQNLPIVLIVAFTIFSNLVLYSGFDYFSKASRTIEIVLVLDVLLLTLILYFSGGPENPFSILYLVHVVLSAVLLGRKWAWLMTGLTSALFAVLFFTNNSTVHVSHHSASGSLSSHLLGMWAAYFLVALISAYCLSRIAEELKSSERKAERLALGQKQLASLTTLSAGAAHELSTPLGTMAIAVCELERELEIKGLNKDFIQDFDLIKSQLKRCKDILGQMSARSSERGEEIPEQISLIKYFSELEEVFNKKFGNKILLEKLEEDRVAEFPQQAVTQSFFALVKNAIEASPENKQVNIRPVLNRESLKVQIADSGSGMPEKILSRVGEPFFTTKEVGQGMGLGVFLTKLTVEHLGGEINFFSKEGEGTTVEVDIPIKQ